MNKVNDYQPRVAVSETAVRATPAPASRQFGEAFKRVGLGIIRGVEAVAGGLVPGGSALSSSLRGARGVGGGIGSIIQKSTSAESAESPGDAIADAATDTSGDTDPMELIELQRQVNNEQLSYSTVSNIMKARHDSAKQVTNNMR